MTELTIGKQYLATIPAHEFEGLDGEKVVFDEKVITIEVLEKPVEVMAGDGHEWKKEPLPKHLKSPEWYSVKNLDTGRQQWFHAPAYTISEI